MSREDDVLSAMKWSSIKMVTPAVIARLLNFWDNKPCDWCPILPPKDGEMCPTVPRSSRDKVARVVKKLVKDGKLRAVNCWRLTTYEVV